MSEPQTADSGTSATPGSTPLAPLLALIDEAENRHGSTMYCKVTTYELRKALGQDVSNWPDAAPEQMTEPKAPQSKFSVANLERRTNASWTVGDTGLTKAVPGGHIMIGVNAAEKLGMVAGADGWEPFAVVPDGV